MLANILKGASRLAIVAAVVIAVFTITSDHRADFGTMTLPGNAVVDVPSGEVDVYYEPPATAVVGTRVPGGVGFRLDEVGGSGRVISRGANRSVESGALTSIDLPTAGLYRATGQVARAQAGATLSFGQDPTTAVARKTNLWLGLVGGGLIAGLLAGVLGSFTGRGTPVERPYDVRPESMQTPQARTYYNG